MVDKKVLRKVYLEKRLTLTSEEFENRNRRIVSKLSKLIDEKNIKHIHLFLPITSKKEVDTFRLIHKLKEQSGIEISIPKMLPDGKLAHFTYDDNCVIKINKYGIPEPVEGTTSNFMTVDMVIVPMVIGDKEGHRIGYGKGYYDRLLANAKALKVGVSLLPLLDKIPFSESTDVALDLIITPY